MKKRVLFAMLVFTLMIAPAVLVTAPVSANGIGIGIDIDNKPGSAPNPLNVESNGVLPVAILTTDVFDATTVDPVTVLPTYGGSYASPLRWAWEDVDWDGDIDLIIKYNTQEVVAMDLGSLAPGDTAELFIEAETFGGVPISGSDMVIIVSIGGP